MGSLYLDRKNLALKMDGQAIALYENEVKQGTVPLHLVERVVIYGNVQLESRVLAALSERAIGVVFLAGRSAKLCAMLAVKSHNDASRRLGQYRLSLDEGLRTDLARRLVVIKVRAQRKALQEALLKRPDQRLILSKAIKTLGDILQSLRNAKENCRLPALRGFEGAAAAAYFAAFTELFPASLNFSGRHKRPPPDPVNACLSLGYTLLHYEAVRACQAVGLDEMLGFYHDVSFGRESLACDLMEPLRPYLDAWVWELFRERHLRSEHFSEEQGRCLLQKAGRNSFFAFYEAKVRPLRRLLRRYAHVLARYCQDLHGDQHASFVH